MPVEAKVKKKSNKEALGRAHGALKRMKDEKDKLYEKLRAKSKQLEIFRAKIDLTSNITMYTEQQKGQCPEQTGADV